MACLVLLSALADQDDTNLTLNRVKRPKQVLVFRHCVRSTKTGLKAKPGFDTAENYTSIPLPEWGTPEDWCTAQGAAIMEHVGRQLAERMLHFTPKAANEAKIIADAVLRDGTTAMSLLLGLSSANQTLANSISFDPLLFNCDVPAGGKALCKKPGLHLQIKESQDALSQIPMPMGVGLASNMNMTRYVEVLEEMQGLIGNGSAGPWSDLASIPVSIDDKGKLIGAPEALKLFSQNLLYSFASGIPYTKASPEQRYAFSAWQYWYRRVMTTPVQRAIGGACHAASVLEELADPSGGLVIYSGHDDTLDALSSLMDISWTAPPFPSDDLPTPPGSAVLFTRHSPEKITAEFLYTVFDGTAAPELSIVPATPALLQESQLKQVVAAKLAGFPDGTSCLEACEAYLNKVNLII